MLLPTIALAAIAGAGSEIRIPTPAGVLAVTFFEEGVVRVQRAAPESSLDQTSLCVIARPGSVKVKRSSSGSTVTLASRSLVLKIDRTTGDVRFERPNGDLLTGENGMVATSATFSLDPAEGIYGLGQHPVGGLNNRGKTIHLQQVNGDIGIPFALSSKAYGILWDNAAVTDVDCRQGLTWKSEVGREIDYYFIAGKKPDDVIGAYRRLTGPAPMMPRWFWGLWQCKEHYATQEELLTVAKKYRELGIPLDGIIQDWQYWPAGQWGSHQFDSTRYPDPKQMVADVHALNLHTLISVWSRFDEGTDNRKELEDVGGLYPATYRNVYPAGFGRWYDAFNPKARETYWNQIDRRLGVLGWDGWWLDATEPELGGRWGEFRAVPTAAGPGSQVFNAYPLMTTSGIYAGQRRSIPDKRVIILTRSAYLGQQRNSAVSWSGDTTGTWEVFRKQIPAGLNFCMSGIPYWNTDIGGFFGKSTSDPAYQELFARWFEYGAFTPMFRVHGAGANKEYWHWDKATQGAWLKSTELRYRLLPYIYSLSWQVTSHGATMMKGLPMDFPDDAEARDVSDQFMFGPALLINPVTSPGAHERSVYLPAQTKWYDFRTEKLYDGGTHVTMDAPYDELPILVRAGSIVPLGPVVTYADEKPGSPLEIRVYPGANGTFTLYQDAGDGYGYEHGQFSTVPLSWDDKRGELKIGARTGSFPGMVRSRAFVIRVAGSSGSGVRVTYNGSAQVVKLAGKPKGVVDSGQRARCAVLGRTGRLDQVVG